MKETFEEICARIDTRLEKYKPIVRRAVEDGVTDIGQLPKEEKNELKKAVRSGLLMKIKDFQFPIAKPRYTLNWDDMISLFRTSPDYIKN